MQAMAPPPSIFALRDRQRAVITSILSPPTSKRTREWHILITDAQSQKTLTPLFPPAHLRRHGITLHTQIDAPRGPVPDVPAIYIISPTPENIAWLLKDLTPPAPLYTSATVCFSTSISRPLLSALAAQLPVPSPVTRLHDLHADFVALEQNLFSLGMPSSYAAMKSVADDDALAQFVTVVASRLFSVLLTLGVVPIIRAQRGGAAEVVSIRLDSMLRDNLDLFERATLSSRALSFRRPLLLMLDRDFDFNAMLHHTWTYQALAHDCLEMELNTVSVHVNDGDTAHPHSRKTYTLDKETDPFWAQNAAAPFPSVAESIEAALKKYRADVEEINAQAGGRNASGALQSSMGTTHLAAAIATLPELSRRKETIDVHTNIATALLENINKRCLDSFFELESQVMSNAYRPATALSAEDYKATVVELLKGVRETATGEKRGSGTAADRLRLFLIYYSVFGRQLPEKTMAEFRGMLHSAGADTSVVDYVGKVKGFRHELVSASVPAVQGTLNTERLKGIMTSVVNRGYRSFANVAQNAKKLIVEQKRSFAVSRILELFMNEQARSRYGASANAVLEGYLLFDPKVVDSGANIMGPISSRREQDGDDGVLSSRQKMQRMLFSDAIVFAVGGGNYVECDNCIETIESISSPVTPKNVLYGTTELMSSEDFLLQLSSVAKSR